MKKHNYVPCSWCFHKRKNPDFDPHLSPCKQCQNTGTVIDPKEILCNQCGECMCPIGTMNEQSPHGLYNISVAGGYDSYHLIDLTKYTFNICEKCLRHLFMNFKIPPHVTNMMGDLNIEDPFKEDQEAYEYRLWEDNGGHHNAYMNGKCNVVVNCPNDAIYTYLSSGSFSEDCSCEDHKETRVYSNTTLTKFISYKLKPFL